MATTWREIVYNTITSLRKNFDDTELQPSQVFFWARIVADRLAKENLDLKEQKGDLSGNNLAVFNSVKVNSDKNGKKYIDIPTAIVDLTNDKGIDYLTYGQDTCTGEGSYNILNVMFNRTTPKGLSRLALDPFEKPSPVNPFYYRVGCKVDGVDVNRLYLLGGDCLNFTDVELGVICGIDMSSCSLDDEIPLPSELIQTLTVNVLQLGRFNTLVPDDRVNEGSDEQRAITTQVPVAQSNLMQRRVQEQQEQEQ